MSDFYSHAPRGAQLRITVLSLSHLNISTHTPLAGRNEEQIDVGSYDRKFLLTRPSRGATIIYLGDKQLSAISTHTPLAGRNLSGIRHLSGGQDFYSHAPRGAQPAGAQVSRTYMKISTHTPLAGRNEDNDEYNEFVDISTHTPLAGRNIVVIVFDAVVVISTHTPLAGRNAAEVIGWMVTGDFYSHAPRGAQQWNKANTVLITLFLLTRPSRGATFVAFNFNFVEYNFYSHAPRGAQLEVFSI